MYIYDLRIQNRPEVDVGEIFERLGCQMMSWKIPTLKGTQESFPTA